MKRGNVSEITLVLGSLLATLIIVVAVWQLLAYQQDQLEAGKTGQIARAFSKNINFAQQINSDYVLRYEIEDEAIVEVKSGYVQVTRGERSSTFPYIGVAERTRIETFYGQTVCFANRPGISDTVRVYLC